MGFPAVLADFAPRLRQREGLHLTSFVQFPDPAMVEALARSGLDSLLFDMQHGMYDERAVLSGVAAAALEGKPALVRVPVDAAGLTSRMLDFGAAGVVAPMINSVADAERLVGYLRFPPAGRRSWGPRRGQTITGLGPADYLARANDLTLAIAMIETREALAALDAILAVPGLDGVFVGPADLSVSLSAGGRLDSPEVAAAMDHVAARTRAAGKIAATFAISPQMAADCHRRGYGLIALMQDAVFLQQGANAAAAAARSQAGRNPG